MRGNSREMKMRMSDRSTLMFFLGCAGLTLGLAGCAAQSLFVSSGPEPRVEDCAMIQQATPSRFVCNGKVYTAVQLADIRNGKKVEVK